tara:strand:+ start:325 stop:513 length:189 start_codon:yes stop_codon:yes gene_type:complete
VALEALVQIMEIMLVVETLVNQNVMVAVAVDQVLLVVRDFQEMVLEVSELNFLQPSAILRQQ